MYEMFTQIGLGGVALGVLLLITTRFLLVLKSERSRFLQMIEKNQTQFLDILDTERKAAQRERQEFLTQVAEQTDAIGELRSSIERWMRDCTAHSTRVSL